ncbi:MAG: hypothetical protein AAGK78_05260, partial [Planctomycetota bacterium]
VVELELESGEYMFGQDVAAREISRKERPDVHLSQPLSVSVAEESPLELQLDAHGSRVLVRISARADESGAE